MSEKIKVLLSEEEVDSRIKQIAARLRRRRRSKAAQPGIAKRYWKRTSVP